METFTEGVFDVVKKQIKKEKEEREKEFNVIKFWNE